MPKDSTSFIWRLTLWCLAGNILFSNGFMLLRVPPVGAGIPINEVLLIVNLVAILRMRHSRFGFSDTAVFLPLLLLWFQGVVQLVIGVQAEGVWAIRDAANLIESGFLFVGFWFASDPRFLSEFSRWLGRMLTFASFYILLYPAQDYLSRFSPVIPSMSGYDAPLFFSYMNPSSAGITAACYLTVSKYGSKVFKTLTVAALIMVLVVFVQARMVYLQLAAVFLIMAIFSPRQLNNLGMVVLVTSLLVCLFLLSGIQLPGRLGTTFTLDFLTNHFAAIWGGGADDASTSAAAEGVDLRIGWWVKIQSDLQRALPTWIFGLGYGMPLTSFRSIADDVVREPHNSFFSIYGRLGIFGIVNFISMLVIVLTTAIRLILLTKRMGLSDVHTTAVTLLCFLCVNLLYASAEGGFEKSYMAVPWYFFAGVIIALHKRLSERERAFTEHIPLAPRWVGEAEGSGEHLVRYRSPATPNRSNPFSM